MLIRNIFNASMRDDILKLRREILLTLLLLLGIVACFTLRLLQKNPVNFMR